MLYFKVALGKSTPSLISLLHKNIGKVLLKKWVGWGSVDRGWSGSLPDTQRGSLGSSQDPPALTSQQKGKKKVPSLPSQKCQLDGEVSGAGVGLSGLCSH